MSHYRRIFNITNTERYLLFSVDYKPGSYIRLVKNNKIIAICEGGKSFVYFLKEYLKLYKEQTRMLFYSKSNNSEEELKKIFKELGEYSYRVYKKYRNQVNIITINNPTMVKKSY